MIRHWQFPLLVVTTYIVTWVSVFVGLITHFFYSLVAHLFDRRDRTLRKLERNGDDREDEYYTIIIGAGFSGLGVGIKLKERGQNNFLIVERLSHIGGTWYANQYPGCAVDVSSDLYSYSFEPNPRWSTRYSAQPEVEDYLERCTQKYGLQPHIQLDTTVARCDWLEEKHVWKVTAMRKSSNETIYFYGRVLVGAYGILSNASYPKNIPGMDIFQGQMCHTAEWNKEIDFKEKRVAVIGTGSSAIQMVPQLHKNFGVSHLYVFQRTPGWVIPLPNRRITSVEKSIFTYFPFIQQCFRSWTYWANETLVLAFVHRWPTRWLLHCIYRYWLHLKVKDDNLRKKLTPSFDFGCKRILLSNDWYPTLQKSNVDLITTQIKEIKEHSIVTSDGCEYPVDVIVWSTGYQVHSIHIPMYGINGKSLSDQWSESSQVNLICREGIHFSSGQG